MSASLAPRVPLHRGRRQPLTSIVIGRERETAISRSRTSNQSSNDWRSVRRRSHIVRVLMAVA